MIHTRRYINKAKYAPKISDALIPLDVGELLKKEIDRDCISFEVVSEATGIPAKRVERIYSNDLPKEDEMCRILEWIMTKTLDEKVKQWFVDRNLHKANPAKQFEKLMEESGELFEGIAKDKPELIKDALGDMQVVLTGLELQINNGADIKATPAEMELLLMVSSLGNLANKLYKHIYHEETKTAKV